VDVPLERPLVPRVETKQIEELKNKPEFVEAPTFQPTFSQQDKDLYQQLVSSRFSGDISEFLEVTRGGFYLRDMRGVFEANVHEWRSGSISADDDALITRLYEDIIALPDNIFIQPSDTLVLRLSFGASRIGVTAERMAKQLRQYRRRATTA
jgi:hypothetical protein